MIESFFSAIGKLISKHLSGGVLWVWVLGGLSILAMFGYVNYLERTIDNLNEDLKIERGVSNSKSAVVDSQTKQHARTKQINQEAENVSNEIANSPDPINYAFEWVLQHRAKHDNTDE